MAPFVIIACGVAFALSLFLTKWLIGFLSARKIYCVPNERSAHKKLIPRGGGIVVMGLILLIWSSGFIHHHYALQNFSIIIGGILLMAVSFADDLNKVPAGIRLAVQIIAVLAGFLPFYGTPIIFPNVIPVWLDNAIFILGWLWFVNLFNFMDGIDGISGVEAISIGVGLTVFGLADVKVMSLFLVAVVAGFLWWNWHPAKIFLGDVGSVPLGYVLGYLLIKNAADGYWVVSLILPLYYLCDASFTLVKRLLRGEKIWQAHAEHAYQAAVKLKKLSHASVSAHILAVNLILIGCAYIGLFINLAAGIVIGFFTVGLLIYYFRQKPVIHGR